MSQKHEYFGKYILLEKLATGGMAEVWLARAPGAGGIGKFVAIKKILPQFTDNPEFIQMFKDEAAIAMNLSHSNIVSIYEFGQESSQLFLVMDYVEGRNLRQILNKMKNTSQRFSVDQVIYVAKEVAAGLDHAHRSLNSATGKPLNITHRDMSPQNIMVSFEGEVRIVDFGIAKAESQLEHTRTGTLKGKFGYMSPEQAEGQATDLRTDIFSLGICLWELLANERLFIANNEINTLRKIRECNVPSLTKINPNIHPELERITMKALTRDRNLRYQTAAALHRDLNRFLNRQFPDFTPHDFSVFIKTLYTDEILDLRRRLVEYAKIPFRPAAAKQIEIDDEKTLVSSFVQTSNIESARTTKPKPGPTVVKTQQNRSKTGTLTATETFGAQSNSAPQSSKNQTPGEVDLAAQEKEESFINDVSESAGHFADNEGEHAASVEASVPISQPPESPEQPIHIEDPEAELDLGSDARINAKSYSDASSPTINTDDISLPSYIGPDDSKPESVSSKRVLSQPEMPKTLAQSLPPIESVHLEPVPPRSETWVGPRRSGASSRSSSSQRRSSSTVNFIIFVGFMVMTYVVVVSYFPKQASQIEAYARHWAHLLSKSDNTDMTSDQTISSTIPDSAKPQGLPQDNNESHASPSGVLSTKGLVVNSLPSGAEIYVNGINSGKVTPARIEVPSDKPFTLTLKLARFLDFTKDNLTTEMTGHSYTATLQKALVAYVDIDVKPPRYAKVFVNGQRIQDEILPITKYAIPAGTPITVRAENPLTGATREETVTLREDQRYKVILELDQPRTPSGH